MPYDWIIRDRNDVDRKLRDGRKGFREGVRRTHPRKGFNDGSCVHCGFEPIGFRKTCAACNRRVPKGAQ